MLLRFLLIFTSVVFIISCSTLMEKQMLPPKAKRIEKKLVKHGDVRRDFYYWMKDRKNPKVLKHLKAENAYTKNKLKPVKSLRKTLFNEMVGRIQKKDSSVPVLIDKYYYYSKYNEKSEYPLIARKEGSLKAKEKVLLDGNQLAKGEKFFNLGAWEQSPNHRFLAFATDRVGRRFYTIEIKDLKTGRLLKTKIENVTSNIVWAEDNKTLFYSKQNPKTLRYEWIESIDIHSGKKNLIYHEKDEKFYTTVFKSRSKNILLFQMIQRKALSSG